MLLSLTSTAPFRLMPFTLNEICARLGVVHVVWGLYLANFSEYVESADSVTFLARSCPRSWETVCFILVADPYREIRAGASLVALRTKSTSQSSSPGVAP